MGLQKDLLTKLITSLTSSPEILEYARNIATAIVSGPANHCAATLSALLIFAGIYPNGGTSGTGDLQPWVPALAYDLENRRRWLRVNVGDPLNPGDVGVVLVNDNTHHIYLVINTDNQDQPLIADNQEASFHNRPVKGDGKSYSPTNYFLRAN